MVLSRSVVAKVNCLALFSSMFFLFPAIAVSSTMTIESDIKELTEDSILITQASISGLRKNTKYYFEGAFTKNLDNPRYFGYTKNSKDEWQKYLSSPKIEDLAGGFISATTDSEGSMGVTLTLRIDKEDQDFKGSGDYFVKVRRFTEGASGTWSDNTLSVGINVIPTAVPTQIKQMPSETPTPKPTVTKTPTPTARVNIKSSEERITQEPSREVRLWQLTNLTATNSSDSDSQNSLPQSLGTNTSIAATLPPRELQSTLDDKRLASVFFIGGGSLLLLASIVFYKQLRLS